MTASAVSQFFYDTATGMICGFFACFFFIKWYLRKNEDEESAKVSRYAVWLEMLFHYRDFTRRRFGRVHPVYYLAVSFLVGLIVCFAGGVLLHVQTLEAPVKYLVGMLGLVVFAGAIALVYFLSRRRYYMD